MHVLHAAGLFLRAEGIKQGLDFEQALQDPDMVELVASTQVTSLACWSTEA